MPVQRRRHTSSAAKRRRSHLALKAKNLSVCPKCKKPIMAHCACAYCGYYRGKSTINVERARKRKLEKEKMKRS